MYELCDAVGTAVLTFRAEAAGLHELDRLFPNHPELQALLEQDGGLLHDLEVHYDRLLEGVIPLTMLRQEFTAIFDRLDVFQHQLGTVLADLTPQRR